MRNFLGFGSIFYNEADTARLGATKKRVFAAIGTTCGGLVTVALLGISLIKPEPGQWLNTLLGTLLWFGIVGILIGFCVVSIFRIRTQTNTTFVKAALKALGKVFLYILLPAIIIALALYFLSIRYI